MPNEIFLEIFKFLPPDSLMNAITSCKRFHEIFEFFKDKIAVIPNINLKEIRLEYVNNALNKQLAIENPYHTIFNNLVKLQDDDFKKRITRKSSSSNIIQKSFSSNFEEFKERFYQRIGSTQKIVEEIFKFTSEKDYKFIIAGSSILNCVTSNRKDFNDLDFFLIRGSNKEKKEAEEQDNEVKDFLINHLKLIIPPKSFYLFMNRSYLTICLKPDEQEEKEGISPPAIQINFRSSHTIEELLSLFDLDCCRFGFDGNHVYTTHQGIRFLNFGVNYIPESQKKICFRNRLEKYWKRGIDTIYTDSKRYYHPLLHFFSDRELRVLMNEISYSKNRNAYGSTYREEINNLYFYPLVNFPMIYSRLKAKHLDSMNFHERHECIDTYDKNAYFIMDNFEDLDGHPSFGSYMKPRNLMEFRYYFYFFKRPLYHGSVRHHSTCDELTMLDFKYCKTCLIYFDKAKPHQCSREKEVSMKIMFMDSDSDSDE